MILTNAQFSDDFTDGDFTNAPTWSGETTNFEVDGSNQLHLLAPAATDISHLSTPSGAINNATWEFFVSLDFNPSGSNLAQVYLVSDQADLEGALNGYFVLIGDSDDEVSLYRQDGTTTTKIIDGTDASVDASPVNVRVQVTRDAAGNWELLIDNTGGSTFVSEGTVFDDTYFQSSFFGVFCDYTSTRSDKFYYDDFVVTGTPYVDTDPPFVSFFQATSPTNLKIGWNENLDQTTAENSNNYVVNQSIGNPIASTLNPNDTVNLTLPTSLVSGTTYELFITNVEDQNGNAVNDTTITFTYISPAIVQPGDVIINEIYADPSPSYGLPDMEYIEIYNTTSNFYFTENWTIDDGGTPSTFPLDTIYPNSYYVISGTSVSDSFPGVNTIELSSFPSLNNSGDPVTLSDENGIVIDFVSYTDDWYNDNVKDDGGYSLELINPNHPCSDANNWSASNASIGGTPGLENSIYDNTPDTEAPRISSVLVLSNDAIQITLEESVDASAVNSATHTISPSIAINTINVGVGKINQYSISLSGNLDSGVVYTLKVSGLQDCWGNTGDDKEDFVLPQTASSGDILINEILFNPFTGGYDFVEIYNNSDKIISLEDWKLANYDDDSVANYEPIIKQQKLFYPGTYWALTEDTLNIQTEYPFSAVGRFIEMQDLPTYSNDSGTVYLLRKDNQIMDKFSYNDEMHFELLDDEDGKSLERISFDADSDEPSNWHTAAEDVGFATPGYKNSQAQSGINNGTITVSPELFSPDNDGMDDNLIIQYDMDKAGYVMTIEIFDATGRLVKVLNNNELIGTRGQFMWNGINENGEKARTGHYIILVSWFDTDGQKFQEKKTCVLAHRKI